MTPRIFNSGACVALLLLASSGTASQSDASSQAELFITGTQDGRSILRTADGSLLQATPNAIVAAHSTRVSGHEVELITWTERGENGGLASYYRIGLGQAEYSRTRRAQHTLKLLYGDFDPLQGAPDHSRTPLAAVGELFIVQFITQPLEAYRIELVRLGASVHQFLAGQAHIVRMNEQTRERVAALPWVRWVGVYHPIYRLESYLAERIGSGQLGRARYRIQVFERGVAMKELVAERLVAMGVGIDELYPDGFFFDATLTEQQLAQVMTWNEVLYADRWTPREEDMNLVRIDGGANFIESTLGFTGQGVRGECMDGNVNNGHPDLQSNPVIFHGSHSGSASHGTPVTGVVFGDGATASSARGMLPDGQPIFADYGQLGNRYTHTAQLLNSPYFCGFQTNSWGNSTTSSYNSYSQEMDDILFDTDVVITQSQSNTGTTASRPQAWAKNIVSVGGIRHQNTLGTGDDSWSGAGSIGPAADGRLKPDLHHWYDSIYTLTESGHGNFGGTSAATPTVAGHFGVFMQMWHEDVFHTSPMGATVFDSRPKSTTSRAMIINSAWSYNFSGTGSDLTRTHQGWGRPDLQKMAERADSMFIVNETDVLTNLQTASYDIGVDSGEPELRVTLVYIDPPGTTSSSQHRINDLSLRVTSPDGGVVYWGNNGLASGNWSTAGGSSNTKDVVENVFIQNPMAGIWTVEVVADEINQDGHTETGALDADFALVVSGTTNEPCLEPTRYCIGSFNSTGFPGVITSVGSTSVAANDLTLRASLLPAGQYGIFYYGTDAVDLPFGDGHRCVGGTIYRLPIIQSDALGEASWNLDITNPPSVFGTITPGSTWLFQYWYRDPAAGGSGFNLTDALSATFCE